MPAKNFTKSRGSDGRKFRTIDERRRLVMEHDKLRSQGYSSEQAHKKLKLKDGDICRFRKSVMTPTKTALPTVPAPVPKPKAPTAHRVRFCPYCGNAQPNL